VPKELYFETLWPSLSIEKGESLFVHNGFLLCMILHPTNNSIDLYDGLVNRAQTKVHVIISQHTYASSSLGKITLYVPISKGIGSTDNQM